MTATLERIVTEFDSLSSKDKLKALSILKKHYYKNEFSKIKALSTCSSRLPLELTANFSTTLMKEVKAARNGQTQIST